VAFKKGDLSQAIAASVCIPGLFVPVEAEGRHLVDGGLVENLPLSLLDGMGAEVKVGVNLARWRKYRKPANVMDVMRNTLDIMTHRQTNQHAKDAQVLIEPHLEQFTSSDFKKSPELISEGYRTATRAIPEIEKALCGQPPALAGAAAPSLLKRMLHWFKRQAANQRRQ
jgi:NTE family protein